MGVCVCGPPRVWFTSTFIVCLTLFYLLASPYLRVILLLFLLFFNFFPLFGCRWEYSPTAQSSPLLDSRASTKMIERDT